MEYRKLKETYVDVFPVEITLPKCRLLCEVDYESMPIFFYLLLL